jgi:hypothetical protein
MAGSFTDAAGRIFISYRREKTAYPAGWLYERLAEHFGAGQVFKDIDSIQPGDDFVEVITRAVGSCDVLLALIGEDWLTVTDEHGQRRLDNPEDFVRVEIEAALARNVRVIPILVNGARMPAAGELPDSLARLVRRQALELSPARFHFDTSRLLRVLEMTLAEVRPAQPGVRRIPTPAADVGAMEAPPEASERRREVEPSPTPGIPPAVPAGAPVVRAASSLPEPQPGKLRRRLSTRAWLLGGAGVGLALIALVAALVARSNPTPSTTGAATTTPPSHGAGTTASASTKGVILRDDFATRAYGWEGDGSGAPGAGYTNGAYRISAPPTAAGSGAGSQPTKASRVYPATPSDIRIEVAGHRLPTSDKGMEYGILCRINDVNAYFLAVSDNYAAIEKWGKYKMLKDAQPRLDANSTNQLQAVCNNVKGQQAVHLELWVNGQKVVETVDTDSPLPVGTVGLAVGTYQTKRASVAEFDNFVVGEV